MTNEQPLSLRFGELIHRIVYARATLRKEIRRAKTLQRGFARNSFTEGYYKGVIHGIEMAILLLDEEKPRKKVSK